MNYRKYLPYAVAILLFIVVCAAYFAPQFKGMTLRQHDMVQYAGMTQDIIEHRAEFGEDPQWEGNMFSGMPSYLINFKHDGALARQMVKPLYFLGEPAALIFIAMLCFFLMLRCCRVNPWIAIAPSLAYGLSTFFFIIIGAGHITQIRALAFAPMLIGGIFFAYRRNMWIGAALTGIFASVQIMENHLQITYYFLFIALGLVINELVRSYREKILPHFLKTSALLLLAGALAAGSNASQLYYINHHTPETMRGGSELAGAEKSDKGLDMEYAMGSWSYGRGETLNLLIPNIYGGSSEGGFSADGKVAEALTPYNARNIADKLPGYWGPQSYTSGPVYIGAVAIFIAVLGMFLLRGRSKWWIAVLSMLAIMLAWGKNFMPLSELFYNYFPLYDKFRTVSMILVIVEWCVPFLAAITLQKLWCAEIPKERFSKGLKYSTIIVGGVALLVFILGGTMSFSSPADASWPADVAAAMRLERASMLRTDAMRSLIFVLLTAGSIWLFYKGSIRKWLFITALCVLVAADMIPVNLRYMGMERFVAEHLAKPQATEADRYILQDKEPGFRVMNMAVSPFNDGTTSYFHRSVGGYHGAKLARYQDLIERYLSTMDMEAYNMLNTKYFILQDKESGKLSVQENPDRNGAAWFVSDIKSVSGAEAEISAIGETDTRRTAIVSETMAHGLPQGLDLKADTSATITLAEYRVNMQKYEYDAPADGIAVFSEIYYDKGWKAYVDGVEAPYFRADYVLRAMALPAGKHTVEFRFEAPHYRELSAVNLVCSLLLIAGMVAAVVVVSVKKRRS